MGQRKSGILLHITSLPSSQGIGDLGDGAYRFVDFLQESGQQFWQILPLTPTNTFSGNSPYSSCSAFASNPLLISPDGLIKQGLLAKSDVDDHPSFPDERTDYRGVTQHKGKLFHQCYENNKKSILEDGDFKKFCGKNSDWLDDYSLFMGLKSHFEGKAWFTWPMEIRDRQEGALQKWREQLLDRIGEEKFLQYLFYTQWSALRDYCHRKNVKIIGDLPIYVDHDSVDVWTHPSLFQLDEDLMPQYVSGVPPDYFSATGQRWGNPVYDWKRLEETGFDWWVQRIRHNFDQCDTIRIDHFRGLVAYWEIPACEPNAVKGQWVTVPCDSLFTTLGKEISGLSIIAEDLGTITPDVTEAMNRHGFPGMRVLLFAFGGDMAGHPYIPENYIEKCVVYTGTHDNNTIHGWIEEDATETEKENLSQYLGENFKREDLHWEFIQRLMMSKADTAIFPLQDVLGLKGDSRMNRPATKSGNWQWRLSPKSLTPEIKEKLFQMTKTHQRY